jgi:hypothetical protein
MANINAEPPEEFIKIIPDFIGDIKNTFPEYEGLIDKWWKPKAFDDIEDEEAKNVEIMKDKETRIKFIFKHSLTIYPLCFFEIIYKNPDIFNEESTVNTEFLPGVSFKYLWKLDISDKTRETIWRYLQLISISIIGCVHNKEAFGSTSKFFENIDEDDFKSKLEETFGKMQGFFDDMNFDSFDECPEGVPLNNPKSENMPSANDIHSHINNMLGGKLGDLAKEIAEDTANDLNIDMDNPSDIKGVFQNIFKNPGKLMGMVKNVGDKLDSKIKSGDIKQSELIAEATEIMNKMKDMPGMGDIQSMLSKMGMGGAAAGGGKMNMNAMQSQLKRNMKLAQMKERMKSKVESQQQQQQQEQTHQQQTQGLSDDQLISVFSTGEKVEKTPVGAKPLKKGKKNEKNKKKS